MGAWLSFFFLLPLPRAAEHVEVLARVAATDAFAPAATADLDAGRLRIAGGGADDWVRYARLSAGASAGAANVSVDGLDSGTLPPAATIARIQVNPDPFSAEFAEPGTTRVEITTRGPSRAFRWSFGTAALGAGGGSPLAPGRARARGLTVGASGGIPALPITFAVSADLRHDVAPAAILAPPAAAGAATTHRARRLAASLFHTSRAIDWRARYLLSRASEEDGGIGGIRTADAGRDEETSRHELYLTAARRAPRYEMRGGLSLSSDHRASAAATPHAAVEVPGMLASHAAPVASDASRRRVLNARVTGQFRGRLPIQAGASLLITDHRLERRPNRSGTLVFTAWQDFVAAADHAAPSGTLFIRAGNGRADLRTIDAAVFLQSPIIEAPGGSVRAGVRLDHQSRDGVRASPRLSASWRARGFALSGGAGLFTHAAPTELFARVVMGDASHLREHIVTDAGFDPVDDVRVAAAPSVTSALDAAYRRRTDLVVKASAARALGGVHAQLEYAYTRGRHAAGTVRTPSTEGWVDRVATIFGVERHHVHLTARWQRRTQTVTAHLEALSARDQTSGALSIQPMPVAGRSVWAPAAGVPPIRFTLVSAFTLPAAIQVSIVASSSAATPYDTVAPGFARDFSLTERAGASRNSGRVPATHTIDLHAAREFRVPRGMTRLLGERWSAGLRVENALNRTNVTSRGDVIGTPFFNRAIDAAPSRSVRLWLSF